MNNSSRVYGIAVSLTVILAVALVILGVSKVVDFVGRGPCDSGDVFDKNSNTCFREGERGPCPPTMVFLDEGRGIGQCSCPYREDRPVVYHRKTNSCHFVFTQGFCENGFWINVTLSGQPVCQKNKCLGQMSGAHPDEIVPISGESCAVLNQTIKGCRKNSVVQFHKTYIHPSCDKPRKLVLATIGFAPRHCPLGSYRNIVGKCRSEFGFDFYMFV